MINFLLTKTIKTSNIQLAAEKEGADMEQLLKQFTLIDFTGIFAPGAVMTLALNFCVLDLTAPFKDFFGENAVMLALYFLTVSYLLGNALHQSGACLEFIWKVDFDHVSYCKSPEIQAAYQRCFYTPMPADIKTAGNRIFHYLQRNSRPERIIIFNSFYTMSRTMVVTLACLIPITIYYRREALVSWPLALQLLAYVLAMILFRCRWSRFEKKCLEEAYLQFSFQKLDTKETPKPGQPA